MHASASPIKVICCKAAPNKYFMNFDHVWQLLENSVPPEVTNYHQGYHPGLGWYLKTAVPNSDQLLLLRTWQAISARHPGLVTVSDHAYDWQTNRIPNCSSIWLKDHVDITLTLQNNQFSYVILPFDDATNRWGHDLRKNLLRYKRQQAKNLDSLSWHNLFDVANLLKQWTTDRQARVKRKGWKVVKNQIDSSNAAHGSKLDST